MTISERMTDVAREESLEPLLPALGRSFANAFVRRKPRVPRSIASVIVT
jgi:hypothetical protein